jgi:hypothetical protein
MMMYTTNAIAVGLFALCLRIGAASDIDPTVFTEEERQYIIDTYAGEGLKQYAKVR